MRSIHPFLIGAIVAASAIACSSMPTAPTDPAVVTLAPGASTTYGALKLTFVRITGDSRCPGDAICIVAGDAQAAVQIDGFGPQQSAELFLVEPSKRTVTRGDYTITFDALTPYPFVSQGPIAPGAYRATFTISRK
jgi:hypothetical protein